MITIHQKNRANHELSLLNIYWMSSPCYKHTLQRQHKHNLKSRRRMLQYNCAFLITLQECRNAWCSTASKISGGGNTLGSSTSRCSCITCMLCFAICAAVEHASAYSYTKTCLTKELRQEVTRGIHGLNETPRYVKRFSFDLEWFLFDLGFRIWPLILLGM